MGWATFDIDIVVATTEPNYVALEAAPAEMNAEFVMLSNQRIVPDLSRITTRSRNRCSYETLFADAVSAGMKGVRVASLAAIARMKRAANRPKDREVLPAIEAAVRKREGGNEP